MTELFNISHTKGRRRNLRRNMPRAESIIWRQLRGRSLEGIKFRRQYSIDKYVVDFYCSKAQLVIEIDGDSHYNDQAEQYDKDRTSYLSSRGLKIIRFTNLEVYNNIEGVLDTIVRAVKQSF